MRPPSRRRGTCLSRCRGRLAAFTLIELLALLALLARLLALALMAAGW